MAEWWEDLFVTGAYRQLEEIAPERTAQQVDFALEALDVGLGDRLLDVACGIGRHSVPFAAAGLRVTGVDISPVYLARAAEQGAPHRAAFARGDMRALPVRSSAFDASVNLFTSFGYFESDAEHQQTLNEIGRALKPGGRFLLDTAHHDGLIRRFRERDWTEIKDGLLLEARRWDVRTGRLHAVWTFVRGGSTQAHRVAIRIYTFPEMERMLRTAGLEVADIWGDWEGGPLTMDSWHMLVLAHRKPNAPKT